MESGRGSSGGLRAGPGGKKMRKRKELDALVSGVGGKRSGGGNKRAGSGGISPQDQLLSESTGEEEYWSSKGGKGRQRYISNGGSRGNKSCAALLRVCTILLVMACLVATLTVMWLFIDIREQTSYLHNQLDQVVAGSQGVPDALQKCHSLSRQLQINQTVLFSQIASLSELQGNFTSQVSKIQSGLSEVEKKLTASPELVNVPHDLQVLSGSVASFGSQIQDLQTTSSSLSEDQMKIMQAIKSLRANFSDISGRLYKYDELFSNNMSFYLQEVPNDTIAKKFEALINNVTMNASALNTSLTQKMQWMLDDQHKDHNLLVELEESSVNVSSRLSTLQNTCTVDISKYDSLSNELHNVTSQVFGFNTRFDEVLGQIFTLEEKYRKLETLTANLASNITILKNTIRDVLPGDETTNSTTLG